MSSEKNICRALSVLMLIVLILTDLDGAAVARQVKRVPKDNGRAYKVMNRNRPKFKRKLLRRKKLQRYKKLDKLGRCRQCTVIVSRKTMPKGERGSIGMVKPTGWHTVRYSVVGKGSSGYLYNRCHLIGWQLTGQNANVRNLITGTRYLNIEGMLPFENRIANFVRRTGKRVLYRVTPYFKNRNLVASGVKLEARSLGDKGRGLRFNVYCYNKQPGVGINYKNGNSWVKKGSKKKTAKRKYVYITPSGSKFHKRSCPTAASARKAGKLRKRTRKWCKRHGYKPCKVCNP